MMQEIKGKFDPYKLTRHLHGLPLRQHAQLQAVLRPRREVSADPAPSAGAGWQRSRFHPRHSGGRHRSRRDHLLPPAVRLPTASCAATSPRAKCCPWPPAPSAASACSPFPRWAGSIATCWWRSAIPTTAPWPSAITARLCSSVFKLLGIQDIGFNQPAGHALQDRESLRLRIRFPKTRKSPSPPGRRFLFALFFWLREGQDPLPSGEPCVPKTRQRQESPPKGAAAPGGSPFLWEIWSAVLYRV